MDELRLGGEFDAALLERGVHGVDIGDLEVDC
jgi:hypothetical protein